jgi:hypothetical protein
MLMMGAGVSENCTAMGLHSAITHLLPTLLSSTLMMLEALRSSETWVTNFYTVPAPEAVISIYNESP